MNKRWIIPLVIIAVILLAGLFRYNIEATKTTDEGVIKWERDRWTGDLWVKVYGLRNSGRVIAVPEWTEEQSAAIRRKEEYINLARDIILIGLIFWLLLELHLMRKKSLINSKNSGQISPGEKVIPKKV